MTELKKQRKLEKLSIILIFFHMSRDYSPKIPENAEGISQPSTHFSTLSSPVFQPRGYCSEERNVLDSLR